MSHRVNQVLVVIALLITNLAYAADPRTQVGEKFLEDETRRQQLETLQRQQKNVREKENFSVIPQEVRCFQVNQIEITGNTLLTKEEVSPIVQQYQGLCLGKEAINQLMRQLTDLYVSDGYITSRVYIPPQDLATGVLKLVVIEGFVQGISINNNSAEDRRKLWWAMPSDWGDHLKLPDIEQGLDQLNRVPSANAQMKLWPGDEVGSTHIHINNKTNDEVRGSIQLSNDGQESTGKQKIRFGVSADNVIGINDLSSLNFIGSENTNALSWSGSFPYRRWTFNLSHSYSEYLNILPQQTDLLGRSNTSSVASDYLLYRDTYRRFNLQSSVTVRRSERHILGVELRPQKLVPVRVAANLSGNHPWGFYSTELGYVHGTKLFGATKDQIQASGVPQAQFYKIDFKTTLVVPFGQGYSFQSFFNGQYADQDLYSSEQVHLGDQSSVRGTESTAVSGDRGFYIQNSVKTSLFSLLRQVNLNSFPGWLPNMSLSVFSDYGQARALSRRNGQSIASAGLSSAIRISDFFAEISWAKVIQSDKFSSGQDFTYLSLTWNAF